MLNSSRLLGLAVLAATVSSRVLEPRSATASLTATNVPTPTGGSPCAKASSASSAYMATNPQAVFPSITPSIALECLHSIPVDVKRDIALID